MSTSLPTAVLASSVYTLVALFYEGEGFFSIYLTAGSGAESEFASEKDSLVPFLFAVGLVSGKEDVMDDMWTRVVDQLAARVTGPMKFRLVMQPAMAAFFAIRAGLADARAGRPPYFWTIVSRPTECAPYSRTDGRAWERYSFSRWCWTLCTRSSSYTSYTSGRR